MNLEKLKERICDGLCRFPQICNEEELMQKCEHCPLDDLNDEECARPFLALFEDDKTLKQIAQLVYVDGLTYSEVGTIVGYSERQVGRLCKKIKERMTVSCVDCIHYEICIGFQALEDSMKGQAKTSKEEFLAMEKHKECKNFRGR